MSDRCLIGASKVYLVDILRNGIARHKRDVRTRDRAWEAQTTGSFGHKTPETFGCIPLDPSGIKIQRPVGATHHDVDFSAAVEGKYKRESTKPPHPRDNVGHDLLVPDAVRPADDLRS